MTTPRARTTKANAAAHSTQHTSLFLFLWAFDSFFQETGNRKSPSRFVIPQRARR